MNSQATRSPNPVRRPSGGVAQGDEPHGCGERLKGAWMPLVSRPPERHRREGSLAAGQTRMSGALSLWLLSARAKRYGAKRSNSRRLARRASEASQVTRRARRNLQCQPRKMLRFRAGAAAKKWSVPVYVRTFFFARAKRYVAKQGNCRRPTRRASLASRVTHIHAKASSICEGVQNFV